jgi:hypothetical protein
MGRSNSSAQISWHDEKLGMKKTSKWVWGLIGLAGFLLLLSSGFHEMILLEAGRFMAPVDDRMDGTADVVILEGVEHIQRDLMARVAGMVSSGKARRMVVVLTRKEPGDTPSTNPKAPHAAVEEALDGLGLDDKASQIIVTSFRHPVTLTSAKEAMEVLAGEGIRSAILVSPGFHMRRSYLVYQHIGDPLQIRIRPYACFDGHNHGLVRWWAQYHAVYDFAEQVIKLAYYMVCGYIPLRFSY